MKRYIYCLILLPIFVFGNPGIGHKKINSYNLNAFGNYPNYIVNLERTDFVSTSGGASGTLSVINNVLSVNFSGGWNQSVMKTGVIKVLTISPNLPDLELGSILTNSTGTPNGYKAKIENNSLIIYSSADVVSNVNTNITTTPSNYAAGVNYSAALPAIFNCNTGEGSSSGSITIKSGIVTLAMSGNWPGKCNLKTGQIMYLNTGFPLQDRELGVISDGTNATNYKVKIQSNYLVIYSTGASLPLTTNAYLNITTDLNESFELLIPNDHSNNWSHGVSYDTKGNVISQSRSYFDDLGKGDITLSKDYVTNKIWGTETTYDNYGRPDKSSFVAPSPLTTFDKTNFLKSSAEIAASAYPTILPLNNITASGEYKASQSITATGTVSNGLTVTLTAPSITLNNTFTITATSGSSFIITAANLPDISANPSLANYYSDSNTDEPYQATATHPFVQNNYDALNPGNIINFVGGNKINGEWKTGYSYTLPAAQEMYYVYGSDYYDGVIVSGKEEVITKFYKSVRVDANGIENVAFSDGEGKLLASARSGGTVTYPVVSLIGTQGYVDVHIPAGITSSQIALIGSSSLYKVYDLKTGALISNLNGGNAYRIQALTPPLVDPKTYIASGTPTYDAGALGITYSVNYYDFAVNVYNKTSQLIKSIQPNGYVSNSSIVASPGHMTSTNFVSTYKYNALGQLIETSNPDQGTSTFAYRKDGQIRYSQSALQFNNNEVSYTNYDGLGRPIESGVIVGNPGIWTTAVSNVDNIVTISGVNIKERTFSVYDYEENIVTDSNLLPTPYSLTIPSNLNLASLAPAYPTFQNNLSGNIAVTYKSDSGNTINAITWYSYDIYGRAEWMLQYIEGLGAKTINYEYDYKGNTKKVLFQKDTPAELFVHQYTYNVNDVLTKVETSTDNTTFITHADYTYYKTGELKRVNIAQGAQGLDYVYTLGGQLKSINHPSLESSKDPGGDSNDVFGLTLDYYNGDYLRTGRNIISSPTIGADYNGNIKASRWANKGIAGDYSGNSANQKGYLYNYDRNNWLTGATFGNTNSATAAINPTSSLAEGALTYDANGNIKTLQRTNETGVVVDNLTYNYANTGNNQLNNVSDAVTTADVTDIENQVSGNYQYDAMGQMIRNNIEDTNYTYNTQGLVTQVKKGTQITVTFSYNERGQKVKKQTITNLGSGNTRTDTNYYVPDLSGNVMSVYYSKYGTTIKPPTPLSQSEISIFGLNRLGVYNKITGVSSYEITDHLGNVRAVIEKESNIPVIKSYADYYPFGEQLPSRNALSNYRYAFQGQELDNETGMEAFQLRLWDGRLGRWLSPDPMRQYESPYLGMGNNPVNRIDPDGGLDIEPGRKAYYEGETYFDNSDNTYYLGKSDGSWLEASQLSSVYLTPAAQGGYLNQFESHRTYDSFNWSAISTGYNYNNGNFEAKVNVRTFNLDLYGNKSSTSFLMGGSFAVLQGSVSAQYENDIFKAEGSAKAKLMSLDGEAGIGFFNGQQGRSGFFAGASGGAAYVKADVEGKLTIFGVHVNATAGGAAGTAEGGIRVGAYYDENEGTYNLEFYQRLGLILGERAGFKISY